MNKKTLYWTLGMLIWAVAMVNALVEIEVQNGTEFHLNDSSTIYILSRNLTAISIDVNRTCLTWNGTDYCNSSGIYFFPELNFTTGTTTTTTTTTTLYERSDFIIDLSEDIQDKSGVFSIFNLTNVTRVCIKLKYGGIGKIFCINETK